MKKIIWLGDSNLSAGHRAIEKVVGIATRLKLEVDLILGDRVPSTERCYWLQLRELWRMLAAPPCDMLMLHQSSQQPLFRY